MSLKILDTLINVKFQLQYTKIYSEKNTQIFTDFSAIKFLEHIDIPLSDIMLYGRWASQRSAQEYLHRGEVSLTALNPDIGLEAWQKCHRYASLGPSA